MDISRWVAHWAAWSPRRTALRFEGTPIPYARLEDWVARAAYLLRERGVGRGDRVAYLGPTCPELLVAFFACARLGAIFVPLNARMPPAELGVYVAHTQPRVLLAERDLHETAAGCVPGGGPEIICFAAGSGIRVVKRGNPDPIFADPWLHPATPVLIAFTSGTTGMPKGAVLTHGALAANAVNTVTALAMTARDEILTCLPMFHIAGLNLLTTPALSVGAAVTLQRRFDPGLFLAEVPRRAVALAAVPPPLTTALVAHPDWPAADLSSLRCVMTGGTTVTEPCVQSWQERGVPVVQGYGLTETGGNATMVPLGDTPQHNLTAGIPGRGCQVCVLDPASGAEAAAEEPGEIVIRGPSLMQGYFDNPEASRAAMPDGWFHTGDLGFLDGEGYLHVIDRIKEIIIVGVSNVYPADLEAVLDQAPWLAASAVVGVPDQELGEVPVAFVVPAAGHSPTPEQVLAVFEGRLARYKHPRRVIILDALPRTPVGKVAKAALRAMAAGDTGLVGACW
jgi:fatty-acyl-CoA synthase